MQLKITPINDEIAAKIRSARENGGWPEMSQKATIIVNRMGDMTGGAKTV